jgi:hypothetical protein
MMQSERYTNTTPAEPEKDSKSVDQLDNRLQLASVAYCVLDDRAACYQDILLRPGRRLGLDWEVYPSVTENPPSLLSEINHSPLGVKEQKILGVGNGKRRIRFLGAVRDFASDSSNKDLLITDISNCSTTDQKNNSLWKKIDSRWKTEQSPPKALSPSWSPSTPYHNFPPSSSAPSQPDT